MTRVCSKCGIERPLEEFPRRTDLPSGRGGVCLACGRVYRRQHYAQNRGYYLAKARRGRIRDRTRAYRLLVEYLLGHPCVGCGERDIRVLQFDHIDPRTKTANVATLVRSGNWNRVAGEIEECAVRCGNCHRLRTLTQLSVGEIREASLAYAITLSQGHRIEWAVSSVG